MSIIQIIYSLNIIIILKKYKISIFNYKNHISIKKIIKIIIRKTIKIKILLIILLMEKTKIYSKNKF